MAAWGGQDAAFFSGSRIEAGVLLRRLQQRERLSMPHSRPMPTVGPRCHELRVPWRIIYRVDPDAVVIAEVFSKKTRTTPRHVLEHSQRRFYEYDRLASER